MPVNYLQQLNVLIKRLLLCFLFYSLSRFIFFIVHVNHFGTNLALFWSDALNGLRFDSFSIIAGNSIFILLSVIPFKHFYKGWYQKLLFWLFAVVNIVFLAANFIDTAYFSFIGKRSGADLLKQIGGQSDLRQLLPRFVAEYWWLILIFVLFSLIFLCLYKKIKVPEAVVERLTGRKIAIVTALITTTLSATVVALRGGLQPTPIEIVTAGACTRPGRAALVLNTPFTLIKTLGNETPEEYRFFTQEQLINIYHPVHHFSEKKFTKQNLVVLVLESFSKEYTSLGRKKSFTPFLDSLMQHGLVFTNAFSNSTKSIEGIPAILASMPSMLDNPIINSSFATNELSSYASLLGPEGYHTAFFHGGKNGTMNFTDWTRQAGYNAYYGKNEYPNSTDFDGYWGIWDEEFLQFTAQKLDDFKQPFHAAAFTLSSHHPYMIPEKYRQKFGADQPSIETALRYADYSLMRFFKVARNMNWYNNTLFVLVADHAAISEKFFIPNPLANLSIPVLFFKPDNSLAGTYNKVYSQIDILPETMLLLGYNKPFFAFGSAGSSHKNRIAFYHGDGNHHVFTDSLFYVFQNENVGAAYNYLRDSSLSTNIHGRFPICDSLVKTRFRAFLQTYNHTLLNDGIRNFYASGLPHASDSMSE